MLHRLLERWAASLSGGADPLNVTQAVVIGEAVAKLPFRERQVLEERYLRAAGLQAMASRLGISRACFNVYLCGARKKVAAQVRSILIRDA